MVPIVLVLIMGWHVCVDAAATAAADTAQQAAEEASSGSQAAGTVELDEFGRDAGLMKRQEQAARAAKRQERALARKASARQDQVHNTHIMLQVVNICNI